MKYCFFIFLGAVFGYSADFAVDSNFPGGNIVVERVADDTVYVRPELRDTEGEWFYWNFRIRGVEGRRLFFKFTRPNVFTRFGPAFTRDNGESWQWLGESSVEHNGFEFTFSSEDSLLQFAVAPAYVQANWRLFIETLANASELQQHALCQTSKDRSVEHILLPARRSREVCVLVTARHHACEMSASFELEGLLAALLNDIELAWARDFIEFHFIPFVDLDGVEQGDQGKNRLPRDHNRDYSGKSLYKSSAAIRELFPSVSRGLPALVVDLHCPWIRGPNNENIYIVGSQNAHNAEAQLQFSRLIEAARDSADLAFYTRDYLPFGTAWNQAGNYEKGWSITRWAESLPNVALAACIEFPYGAVYDQQVTPEKARRFGARVARAMQDFAQGLMAGPAE